MLNMNILNILITLILQVNQFVQVAQKCQSTIAESGTDGVSQQDLQTNSNMWVNEAIRSPQGFDIVSSIHFSWSFFLQMYCLLQFLALVSPCWGYSFGLPHGNTLHEVSNLSPRITWYTVLAGGVMYLGFTQLLGGGGVGTWTSPTLKRFLIIKNKNKYCGISNVGVLADLRLTGGYIKKEKQVHVEHLEMFVLALIHLTKMDVKKVHVMI